jgi:hypothetical protein
VDDIYTTDLSLDDQIADVAVELAHQSGKPLAEVWWAMREIAEQSITELT